MGNGKIKRPCQFFISREEELKKAVEQFFFLHYPTSRKVDDKYISRTNAEDRADYIRDLGKEYFDSNEAFDYLREPDIPFCFLFVFNSFLEIFNCCNETMTWTDILSYAIMRNVKFTQTEVDYILKCKNWADAQIKKMRDESDDDNRISTEEAEGQI